MKDDQFLYDFQKAPRAEFASGLYQKISANRRVQPQRLALSFGLTALLLAMVLLVSPPARGFAQDVINRLSSLFISHEPTYAEQFEATLQSVDPAAPTETLGAPVEWHAPGILTLEEACSLAGFEVAEIKALPEGLALVMRAFNPADELNPLSHITSTFQSGGQTLVFSQAALDANAGTATLPVGESPVAAVTVQGVQGVWIENLRLSTYVDENQQVAPAYANLLIWERDSFQFWLQSNPGFSLETMLQMANSVSP